MIQIVRMYILTLALPLCIYNIIMINLRILCSTSTGLLHIASSLAQEPLYLDCFPSGSNPHVYISDFPPLGWLQLVQEVDAW